MSVDANRPSLQPMQASSIAEPDQVLQTRMTKNGYLLFRNLLPATAVTRLRQSIASILHKHGWIKNDEDTGSITTIRSPMREGEASEGFFDVYDEVMRLEPFYALAHQPVLLQIMQRVLASDCFPHPLSICRFGWPEHDAATTPPHQDFPNNQGSLRLTAAWIPLTDVPVSRGGLAILQGSNQGNTILPLDFHLGPGNRQAVLPDHLQRLPWVSTHYRPGDVLLFFSTTVHRALPNHDSQHLRLSVDYRYQPDGDALTPPVLEPHFARESWDSIYQGWEDKRYCYYWQQHDYTEVPWSDEYHRLPETHLNHALRAESDYRRQRQAQQKQQTKTREPNTDEQ
ncbi:phytanoyl-CoA dioxygenase family protein [Pseudohongiella acticola]|uniref:phytanoyl-CoA dioxygenase family protein n=1 Tax=Pseudohongiella acticola TaxID=1524254 RepID=UPI0030EBC3A4